MQLNQAWFHISCFVSFIRCVPSFYSTKWRQSCSQLQPRRLVPIAPPHNLASIALPRMLVALLAHSASCPHNRAGAGWVSAPAMSTCRSLRRSVNAVRVSLLPCGAHRTLLLTHNIFSLFFSVSTFFFCCRRE